MPLRNPEDFLREGYKTQSPFERAHMLNMAEKLSEVGLVPNRPAKTTFPDGRMATKEAWNYCKVLCENRGVSPPTLKTFKWHLKHGNLIEAGMEPNPFGGAGPDKVYAITCEAVVAFVEELEKRPEELEVAGPKKKKSASRRSAEVTTPPAPKKKKDDDKELTSREAFAYVHRQVKVRTDLNHTTFGFYLAYDVIPSRLEKSQRLVKVGDLDAFLELAPDGVYANHLEYAVATKRAPEHLSLKDAYDHYRSIDPNPISISDFRSVVAAGIIQAIRTANNPKAPVVGFRRQDINGFLATRQRIQEKLAEARKPKPKPAPKTTLVARVMQEALDKANFPGRPIPSAPTPPPRPTPKPKAKPAPKPVQAEARPKPTPKPKVREPRWVPTREAYEYYKQRADRPLTDSWFRDKVYRGDLFRKKIETDKRPNNPSGKKYFVDLNSVDDLLAQDPKKKPRPQKSWAIETAYHKFEELIPIGLSLLQFKRLVNTGMIRSVTRSGVVHVRRDAVEAYFKGLEEGDAEQVFQMGSAYDYYCSRCTDPVAKAHFSRWVSGGEIEGAEKNDDGIWTITAGCIDSFLDRHPTGRMRTNKSSRVATETRTPKKKKKATKEGPSKPAAVLPEVPEGKAGEAVETTGSLGSVSVSIADYPNPAEMQKAIALLKTQGFDVKVKP